MLIENDKRGISLQLLYSDEKFAVPKNVYIIGMMNTADRSLAMLDYALRRRFAFFEIKPGFETDGFREYRMAIDNEKFNKLINCVENLNNAISADESLGDVSVSDIAISAIYQQRLLMNRVYRASLNMSLYHYLKSIGSTSR
ncbi:hypothetical protein K420107F6_14410 [Lactonifactor longoviformis]